MRKSLPAIAVIASVLPLAAFTIMHLHLTDSYPEADARLETAPTEIRLTFSARPEAALSRLTVMRSDSVAITTAKPEAGADSLSLKADVSGPMAAGTYLVAWRAAGKDGHPVSGRFSFTVTGGQPPAASAAPATSRDHSGR